MYYQPEPGDVKVYNILSRRPEVIKDWQGLARGLKIKETQIEIIRDKNSRLNDKLYDVSKYGTKTLTREGIRAETFTVLLFL